MQDKRFAYGLLLALAIALPFIFRTDFLRSLLVLGVIFAMLTLSLDIIVSGMGQFSFGHQAFFAIGAYTSALLSVKLGVTPFVGFLAAFAFTGLVGLLVGYVALRATRGVYLAIVTLGFSVILSRLVRYFREFTRGTWGIPNIPPPVIAIPNLPEIVIKSELSYYFLALAFLFLTMYLISKWQRSRFGRAVATLGENEMLARSIGIAPVRLYTMAFVLATAIAGLSGALYAHYLHHVSPALFELPYMVMLLVILFVGGVGTMGGPVLGAFIFTFVPELLPTSDEVDLFIFGAMLLIFILFMPRGIYPPLRSLGKNFIRRLSRSRKTEIVNKMVIK
ncbi:MAG: branched-chain amino acid ABC transporter permease [Desulfobacteraceae bacterium]|nr:branched-chain amino acid ABC transporter permease [Desulfobacteraceae bacterium]